MGPPSGLQNCTSGAGLWERERERETRMSHSNVSPFINFTKFFFRITHTNAERMKLIEFVVNVTCVSIFSLRRQFCFPFVSLFLSLSKSLFRSILFAWVIIIIIIFPHICKILSLSLFQTFRDSLYLYSFCLWNSLVWICSSFVCLVVCLFICF